MKSRQRVPEQPVPETGWSDSVARTATEDVRELLRAERRRRRGRWFAGGLVVLAVGAVAVLLVRSSLFAPVAGAPAPDAAQPAVSASHGAMLDPAHPFDSTPAARWPDGGAGIVPPAPAAVGDYTAEEVAEGMRLVRDALVASRLDPRLLVDHDPAGYLGLLAPDARRQLEPLFGGGREPEVQSLVSLVAAGNALLPVDAKVSGSMSATKGEKPGELVVHTNYVFAYAFRPVQPTRLVDAMNAIVVVRADVDYVLRKGDGWAPGSRGLWFGDATGFGYSIGCEAYRKGFLAPAVTERSVTRPAEAREPGAFFDPTAPLPAAGGCRA